MTGITVILPAHDEAGYLGTCLDALLQSEVRAVQIVVVANACRDATADVARGFQRRAAARGWTLEVVETPDGGKLNALNLGDRQATGGIRVYLDADVTLSPLLLGQIAAALDTDAPRYACGSPRIAPAQSAVTRAYARFWATLPFFTEDAPGFGLFAVNAAGRARWDDWPDIISDDTFARLNFAPAERHRLPGVYDWPMVEGFANLVKVRRRQNRGVDEVARRFPALIDRNAAPRPGWRGIAARAGNDPVGFAVYAGVALAVKTPLFASKSRWARGR